jgi:hypothetical protein
MALLKLSKQAILQGELLAEDYYKVKVIGVEIKPPAEGKKGLNFVYNLEFEADDRQMPYYVNTAALGMHIKFLSILEGKPITPEMAEGEGLELDTDNHIGKKLTVKVVQKPYNGRLVNNFDGAFPYETEKQGFV